MKLYLDGERLQRVANEQRAAYSSADPFPHVVIDDLFPEEALDTVLGEFPSPDSRVWNEYKNFHERKLETQGEGKIGAATSLILYQFNSAPFLQFLETLTGIRDLIPDPYFFGGGLHQIRRGGKLGIHADFSRHNKFPLDRRLNALIYLNKDWKEEWGGHLEFWATDMSRCVRRVLPVFNRLVVFSTTDWAYHGHPEPLACPDDRTRKSIALYYYTNGRPPGETRPGKETTMFMNRPGEVVPEEARRRQTALNPGVYRNAGSGLRHWAKRVLPPVLVDAAMRVRHRGR